MRMIGDSICDANLEAMIRDSVNNPSGALTSAQLQGLTSFVATSVGITDLTGLAQCTNLLNLYLADNTITSLSPLSVMTQLEVLHLNQNQITSLAPLSGLTALESLYVSENAITSLAPVAGLPALENLQINDNLLTDTDGLEDLANLDTVYLQRNLITSLGGEPFGQEGLANNDDLGAGDNVYLDGNPLSAWAACVDIPDLEGRQVTVDFDAPCNTDPGSAADYDNDGLSNADEFLYSGYYDNDAAIQAAWYTWGIGLAEIPGISPACFAGLDTVTVTVDVIGQGSVFLGDGDATEGNPQAWTFAQYERDCATLCTGSTACDYHSIPLDAVDSGDWVFSRWEGLVEDRLAASTDSILDGDHYLHAVFSERVGISDLDFVGDLSQFLVDIGYNTEPIGVYYLDYDYGDFDIDSNGHVVPTANGIPDAAEFAMLEKILKTPTMDMSDTGGVVHDFVWDAFQENVAQAEADFVVAGHVTPPSHAVNTVAAYMTLGSYGHQQHAKQAIADPANYDVDTDTVDYGNINSQHFGAKDDADNDGVSNASEWKTTAANSTGDGAADIEDYANAATDPGESGPPPGDGGGEEDCGCWNDDCGPWGNLTITEGDQLGVEACIKEPAPCPAETLVIYGTTDLQLGRELSLDAIEIVPEERIFGRWSAPDTLIDGSVCMTESFTHAQAGALVMPGAVTMTNLNIERLTLYYTVHWTASGPGSELVHVVESDDTHILLTGPVDAHVRLSFEYPNPLVPGTKPVLYGWTSHYSGSIGRAVLLRLGSAVTVSPWVSFYECAGGVWPHTVTAGTGGLAVMGVGTPSYGGGPFIGGAPYCAAPETTNDPRPYVKFRGIPKAGYEFQRWEGLTEAQGAGIPLSWINVEYLQEVGTVSATALFAKCPTLTLISEIADGDGSAACAGYATANPAKKFYTPATINDGGNLQAELVTVRAHVRPGYKFLRWTGEGPLFNSDGSDRTDGKSLAGDADEASWVTDTTIYVKMVDDQGDAMSRTLTAVFRIIDIDLQFKTFQRQQGGGYLPEWVDDLQIVSTDLVTARTRETSSPDLSFLWDGIAVVNSDATDADRDCSDEEDDDTDLVGESPVLSYSPLPNQDPYGPERLVTMNVVCGQGHLGNDQGELQLNDACVLEGDGVLLSSFAPQALTYLEYFVDESQESDGLEAILDLLPFYRIFVFNGHSDLAGLTTGWVTTARRTVGTPMGGERAYLFVFFNACGTAQNASGWRTAWAADSFLGWFGLVPELLASEFDRWVWYHLEEGYSTAAATVAAFGDILPVYALFPGTDPETVYPYCLGSVTL